MIWGDKYAPTMHFHWYSQHSGDHLILQSNAHTRNHSTVTCQQFICRATNLPVVKHLKRRTCQNYSISQKHTVKTCFYATCASNTTIVRLKLAWTRQNHSYNQSSLKFDALGVHPNTAKWLALRSNCLQHEDYVSWEHCDKLSVIFIFTASINTSRWFFPTNVMAGSLHIFKTLRHE